MIDLKPALTALILALSFSPGISFSKEPGDLHVVKLQQALEMSIDNYLTVRESVLEDLIQTYGNRAWPIVRGLDQKVILQYIVETSEWLRYLPIDNPGREIKATIDQWVGDDRFPINIAQVSFYSPEDKQTGSYSEHSQSITLSVQPKLGILLSLVHEMSHLMDKTLYLSLRLDKIERESGDRAKVNFIRNYRYSYLPEIEPRMNACNVFIGLYGLSKIAEMDLDFAPFMERYEPVLNGDQSCFELSLQELESSSKMNPPRFSGAKGTRRGDTERAYLRTWLNQLEKSNSEVYQIKD